MSGQEKMDAIGLGANARTRAAQRLQERLRAGLAIDVRGHGKAGGGLILAMQSFGAAIAMNPAMDVQDWQGRQRLRLHADRRRAGRDGLSGDRVRHRCTKNGSLPTCARVGPFPTLIGWVERR